MQTTSPISTCQAPGCTNTFPTLANAYQTKKYCTRKCRDRVSEASSRRQAYYRTEAGKAAAKRKSAKHQAKKLGLPVEQASIQPCNNCGNYFVAPTYHKFCSKRCQRSDYQRRVIERKNQHRTCKNCGVNGVSRVFCTDDCRNAYFHKLAQTYPERRMRSIMYKRNIRAERRRRKECQRCGEGGAVKKFCSSRCMRQSASARRQAKKRNAFIENVSTKKLAKMQNWDCHLCGGKISKTAKWPHPDSLSLDHLIPLSLGGEHSYYNCVAAHLRCNFLKSNNAVNEQLKLPIPGLVA